MSRQQGSAYRPRIFLRLGWELRLALSWRWLLPPLALAFALWLTWHLQLPSDAAGLLQARAIGEVLFPLAVAPLAVDILPREVQRRTVGLLATRTRLWVVIVWRLALLGAWLAAVLAGTLIALGVLWPAAGTAGWFLWAIVPSTFCLLALTLLAALFFASSTGAFIVAGAWWGANLFLAVSLGMVPPALTHWLPALLLFGATFPPATPLQLSWEQGKWVSVALGLACTGLALAMTRHIVRLMHEPEE